MGYLPVVAMRCREWVGGAEGDGGGWQRRENKLVELESTRSHVHRTLNGLGTWMNHVTQAQNSLSPNSAQRLWATHIYVFCPPQIFQSFECLIYKGDSKNFLKIPHQYIYIVLVKVTTDLTVNLLTMESWLFNHILWNALLHLSLLLCG